MPGSATHAAYPTDTTSVPQAQPQQQQPVVVNNNNGTIPAVLDAGGAIVTRLGAFSPQQALTVAMLLLMVFVCSMMGYQTFAGQRQNAETTAILLRSMESESEKNRMATATEFERNRVSLNETAKATLSSYQQLVRELGKLEQAVTQLNSSVNELRRKMEDEGLADPCGVRWVRAGGS